MSFVLVFLVWTSLHFKLISLPLKTEGQQNLYRVGFPILIGLGSTRSPSGFYRLYSGCQRRLSCARLQANLRPSNLCLSWPGYTNPWVDSNRLLWLYERAESIRTERLVAGRYLASICKHSIKTSAREERKWIFAHIYIAASPCPGAYACTYVRLAWDVHNNLNDFIQR